MHRTQILLEDRQYAELKAWARRSDKKLSELVRIAVDRLLGRPLGKSGASLKAIRALARDPKGVAGRDHDAFLYDSPR